MLSIIDVNSNPHRYTKKYSQKKSTSEARTFAPGSRVEGKFAQHYTDSRPSDFAWYKGVIATGGYNSRSDTYAVHFNDGDFQPHFRARDLRPVSDVAYILMGLDFSGSQNNFTYNQAVELNKKYGYTSVHPFGGNHSDALNKTTTLNKLFSEYITPRTEEGYGFSFPWATYTDFIKTMFEGMPTDRPVQLVISGDGNFNASKQSFIEIVEEMMAFGRFRNVVSFTIMFSNNASETTRTTLTTKLEKILTGTDSLMKFSTHHLSLNKGDMVAVFDTLNETNVTIPTDYLKFGDELYHKWLTPSSIATIMKEKQTLIPKYIQKIISTFDTMPLVLSSESNITRKIYKALVSLKGFKNDTFNIQLYFLNAMSTLNDRIDSKKDLRNRIYKSFKLPDESTTLLMIARLQDKYSGEYLTMTDVDPSVLKTLSEFMDIMSDGSHFKLGLFLRSIFNEHSTSRVVTSSTGFPKLMDSASIDDKIYSFNLIGSLFGHEVTISNSSLLVFAMFFLTNENVSDPYLLELSEFFLFANVDKMRSLLYTDDGEFQPYVFSSFFARIMNHTIVLYKSKFMESGFSEDELTTLQTHYRAICKMSLSATHTYDFSYTLHDYDIKRAICT